MATLFKLHFNNINERLTGVVALKAESVADAMNMIPGTIRQSVTMSEQIDLDDGRRAVETTLFGRTNLGGSRFYSTEE